MEPQYTSKLLSNGNEITITGSLIKDRHSVEDIFLFIVHCKVLKVNKGTSMETALKLPDNYITVPNQSRKIFLPELSLNSPVVHLTWLIKKNDMKKSNDIDSDLSESHIGVDVVLQTEKLKEKVEISFLKETS